MSEYVQRVKQLAKPIHSSLEQLSIELTERCNNHCIHCNINLPVGDAARQHEMTTWQVKDVLQQAAALGCLQVHLTGGEPLIRPDFEELYIFSRRLGLKVLLFTNACLITPHLADLFARIPPRLEIEITVYGMHQESYEAVTRSPGSYAQFNRGINLLWERHVPFLVKSTLLPPNYAERDEFEAGPPGMPWKTTCPILVMVLYSRTRRDDTQKNRQIESLRLSPQEIISVVMRDAARYHPWTRPQAAKLLQPPGDQLFNCSACKGEVSDTFCVDAYGTAQPCMLLRASDITYPLFSSRNGDKKPRRVDHAMIRSSNEPIQLQKVLAQFARLGELRATNPEYLRRCAHCFLKGICEQCPATSWVEYGTLDKPVEYLCELAHAWARYQGWLSKNEHGWEITQWLERF
jgi:MoaA/NifB/PqqE/SkfB family radical SAM enzyme